MIQLFQESIPFSSKRVEAPVSQNGTNSNPIIMPFALNTTIGSNVFETVFYIKNTDVQAFYKDVVILLMTENSNADPLASATGQLTLDEVNNTVLFALNEASEIPVSLAFPYTAGQPTIKAIDGSYKGNYSPVVNHQTVEAKFSYGYDEISALDWENLNQVLVIPMIGNSTTPDISYTPIRMRIKIKENNIAFTQRDFFLDISFGTKGDVEGQL